MLDDTVSHGIAFWSRQPRWPIERVRTIPGQVRGVLLRDWAPLLDRRWGAGAAQRVRDRAGDLAQAVPDAPRSDQWLPIAAQIALTDAIIDEFLAGDALRLEPLLTQDTVRDLGLPRRMLLRAYGPVAGYRRVADAYQRAYDIGHCQADVRDHGAVVRCMGATAFGNPTWRTLHLIGHGIALALLTGRSDCTVAGRAMESGGFEFGVRWR